jgi:hypothetical protein
VGISSPLGISFDKERKKYEAYVYNDGGRKTRLGWFADSGEKK